MENFATIKVSLPVWEERNVTTMQTDFVYDYTPSFVRQCVLSRSRYTGKERDTESGLDYFGARYYSSSMGRFSSPDPSGLLAANPADPQSWNMYAYARNNPLINIDPTGLDCVHINNDTGADEGFESGDCDNSTEEKANSGYYVDGTVNQISMNSQGQVLGYSTSTADGYFPGTPGASSTDATAVNLNPYSKALSNPNQSVSVTANPTNTSLTVDGSSLSTLIPSGPLKTPNPNITHHMSANPKPRKLTPGEIRSFCAMGAMLRAGGTVPGGAQEGTASSQPSLPPDPLSDRANAMVESPLTFLALAGATADCINAVSEANR